MNVCLLAHALKTHTNIYKYIIFAETTQRMSIRDRERERAFFALITRININWTQFIVYTRSDTSTQIQNTSHSLKIMRQLWAGCLPSPPPYRHCHCHSHAHTHPAVAHLLIFYCYHQRRSLYLIIVISWYIRLQRVSNGPSYPLAYAIYFIYHPMLIILLKQLIMSTPKTIACSLSLCLYINFFLWLFFFCFILCF